MAKAWVKTSRELPVSIGLLLEDEGHVVEAASDIGALADEAARQDRVAVVHYALRRRFCLTSDAFGGELGEVHLAIVGGESKRGARWTPSKGVVPNAGLHFENDLAALICDSSEWPTSIGVTFRVVRGGDNDETVGAGASDNTSSKRVKSDARDRGFVEWLAKRRLVRLGQGHPEVKIVVECAHEDMSRASTNAELISTVVPRSEQV